MKQGRRMSSVKNEEIVLHESEQDVYSLRSGQMGCLTCRRYIGGVNGKNKDY